MGIIAFMKAYLINVSLLIKVQYREYVYKVLWLQKMLD